MKSVIESKNEFEALDPILQAEYTEANGLFVLNADGIREHPDVKNLASALEAVKGKKTDAATKLAELEAKIEADKKAAEKAAEEADLLRKKEYDKLAEMKEQEAANSKAELDKLKAEILQGKIDNEAAKIATEINPKDAVRQHLLKREVKDYIKSEGEEIKFLGADGTQYDRKSIIEKMEKEFPLLAAGNPASGGGANGNQNNNGGGEKSTVDILYPSKG